MAGNMIEMGGVSFTISADGKLATAELNKLQSSFDASGKKAEEFTGGMKSKFSAAAGAVKQNLLAITASLTATFLAAKKLLNNAIDAQEVTNKYNVVFDGVKDIASKALSELTSSYGMAETAAKTFLSSTQDILKPLGVAADSAAEYSAEAVKLAADLASFNNLETEDVLGDIQSMMVGNYEVGKKYGIVLSETIMKQNGVTESTDAGTKALKALELITTASADAVGDYSRSAGSAAQLQKEVNAGMTDLGIELGEKLLPIWTKFLTAINNALDWFLGLSDGVKSVITVVGLMSAAFLALLPVMSAVGAAATALGVTLAVSTGGLTLIAGAVVALGAGLLSMPTRFERVENAATKLKEATEELSASLTEHKDIVDQLAEGVDTLTESEKALLEAQKDRLEIEITQEIYEQIEAYDELVAAEEAAAEAAGGFRAHYGAINADELQANLASITAIVDEQKDKLKELYGDEWAEHVTDNIFHVGSALDGTEQYNVTLTELMEQQTELTEQSAAYAAVAGAAADERAAMVEAYAGYIADGLKTEEQIELLLINYPDLYDEIIAKAEELRLEAEATEAAYNGIDWDAAKEDAEEWIAEWQNGLEAAEKLLTFDEAEKSLENLTKLYKNNKEDMDGWLNRLKEETGENGIMDLSGQTLQDEAFQLLDLYSETASSLKEQLEAKSELNDLSEDEEILLAEVTALLRDVDDATDDAADSTSEYADEIIALKEEFNELYSRALQVQSGLSGVGDELKSQVTDGWDGIVGALIDVKSNMDDLSTSTRTIDRLSEKLSEAYEAYQNLRATDTGSEEMKTEIENQIGVIDELTTQLEAAGEAQSSATSGIASGWIAAAQAVADFALEFWEVYEETGDWTESLEEGLQSIADQIPVIGGLVAKVIDKIWETETEKREKEVNALNAEMDRFEHEMAMGHHEFLAEQISYYEEMLQKMVEAGAAEEDIWAMEERIYDLRKQQTEEIERQNELLKEQSEQAAEEQFRLLEDQFQRLIDSGQLNMNVSEDIDAAIGFYQNMADQAHALGMYDLENEYLNQIASLEGTKPESHSYGDVSYGSDTAQAVADINSSISQVGTGTLEGEAFEESNAELSNIQAETDILNEAESLTQQYNDQKSALDAAFGRLSASSKAFYDYNLLWNNITHNKEWTRRKNAFQGDAESLASLFESYFPGSEVTPWTAVGALGKPSRFGKIDFKSSLGSARIQNESISYASSVDTLRGIGLAYDDLPAAVRLSQLRTEYQTLTGDTPTFHEGGIIGGAGSFTDFLNSVLSPSEALVIGQRGELVIPRGVVENSSVTNTASSSFAVNGDIVIQTNSESPKTHAREVLRALEKEAKRNGYTLMKRS